MSSQIRREALNFEPFKSPNSIKLRIASGYFILLGAWLLTRVLWIGVFAESTLTSYPRISPWQMFTFSSILVIASLGMLWTGLLLRDRSRRGGILALVFVILPLVGDVLRRSVDGVGLILTVIGVAIIASVWEELT